jgi:hypothetical protein
MLKKSTIFSRISALVLAFLFVMGSFSVNAQVTDLAFLKQRWYLHGNYRWHPGC